MFPSLDVWCVLFIVCVCMPERLNSHCRHINDFLIGHCSLFFYFFLSFFSFRWLFTLHIIMIRLLFAIFYFQKKKLNPNKISNCVCKLNFSTANNTMIEFLLITQRKSMEKWMKWFPFIFWRFRVITHYSADFSTKVAKPKFTLLPNLKFTHDVRSKLEQHLWCGAIQVCNAVHHRHTTSEKVKPKWNRLIESKQGIALMEFYWPCPMVGSFVHSASHMSP